MHFPNSQRQSKQNTNVFASSSFLSGNQVKPSNLSFAQRPANQSVQRNFQTSSATLQDKLGLPSQIKHSSQTQLNYTTYREAFPAQTHRNMLPNQMILGNGDRTIVQTPKQTVDLQTRQNQKIDYVENRIEQHSKVDQMPTPKKVMPIPSVNSTTRPMREMPAYLQQHQSRNQPSFFESLETPQPGFISQTDLKRASQLLARPISMQPTRPQPQTSGAAVVQEPHQLITQIADRVCNSRPSSEQATIAQGTTMNNKTTLLSRFMRKDQTQADTQQQFSKRSIQMVQQAATKPLEKPALHAKLDMLADGKPSAKNMEILADDESEESLEIIFEDLGAFLSDDDKKDTLTKQLEDEAMCDQEEPSKNRPISINSDKETTKTIFRDRNKAATSSYSYADYFDKQTGKQSPQIVRPGHQSIPEPKKSAFVSKHFPTKTNQFIAPTSKKPSLLQSAQSAYIRPESKPFGMANMIFPPTKPDSPATNTLDLTTCGNKSSSRAFTEILKNKKKEQSQQELIQRRAKLKAELKKKQMLEEKKKREHENQLNDFMNLFRGPEKIDAPMSGLQSLVSSKDDQVLDKVTSSVAQDEVQKRSVEERDEDEERRRQYYENEMRKAKEEQERRFRFHDRNNVEELISPILSLELVKEFYDKHPDELQLPKIPTQFESHPEYMVNWMPLFLYETYNQIISSRGTTQQDRELSELLGTRHIRNDEDKNFICQIKKVHCDVNYVYLRVYDHKNIQGKEDRFGNYIWPQLDKLRDFDILLFSTEDLASRNQPIKKVCDAKFLHTMLNNPQAGQFLGLVHQQRKKDQNYIEVKVDLGYDESLFIPNQVTLLAQQQPLFCYFFDSLLTTVREFRTIKCCEFYATSKIILNPKVALDAYHREGATAKAVDNSMNGFIRQHRSHFNDSQAEALQRVAEMRRKDLLLIQGPPGTGKTHTIHGILNMLACCQRQKILVCTPSNAAIDEIVLRLANSQAKIFGSSTVDERKVLRIGAMDYEPLEQVRRLTLDYKLEKRIQAEQVHIHEKQSLQSIDGKGNASVTKQQLNAAERDAVKQQQTLNQCAKAIKAVKDGVHDRSTLIRLIQPLLNQNQNVNQFLDSYVGQALVDKLERYRLQMLKDPSKPSPKQVQLFKVSKEQKKKFQRQIIQEAQIVCTTLSMSASEMMRHIQEGEFEYLIVDEACQSVELTNLIPFCHEPRKVILVGDQQQLPATVFSENAGKTGYSRSLFERFLECGVPNFMLNIQYRMDPAIREFPSNQFYHGKLKDADMIAHRLLDPCLCDLQTQFNLKPTIFFDLAYSKESPNEKSKENRAEADFICQLLLTLCKANIKENNLTQLKGRIGIISPYKSQVRLLKHRLLAIKSQIGIGPGDQAISASPSSSNMDNGIEVNTVDAYQGREKDIIIISTVRTDGLGFLNDYRRMNVAITRARHFLWVVGNSKSLINNDNWKALISKRDQTYSNFKFGSDPSGNIDVLRTTLVKQRVPDDYYYSRDKKRAIPGSPTSPSSEQTRLHTTPCGKGYRKPESPNNKSVTEFKEPEVIKPSLLGKRTERRNDEANNDAAKQSPRQAVSSYDLLKQRHGPTKRRAVENEHESGKASVTQPPAQEKTGLFALLSGPK